ncbi:MAG: hypothetical protein AAGB51_01065 [Planctomycetota bacterium]
MTRALRPVHVETPAVREVLLRGRGLEATVVPELGAKVTELRSRSGRDWLWNNDRLPHRPGAPGSSYEQDFDSGGWDELFPNVSPVYAGSDTGAWAGLRLTDHGEIWCRPWTVQHSDLSVCRTFCESLRPGYRLDRTLSTSSACPTLRAEYEFTNHDRAPMPFVWAAHPIFSLHPGMSLLVDPATPVVIGSIGGVRPAQGSEFARWSDLAALHSVFDGGKPLSETCLTSEFSAKIFVAVGHGPTIGLADSRTGERMSIVPLDESVPYVAIWLNLGGWSGDGGPALTNIGIEPTSSAHEVPGPGVQIAAPGETRRWAFEVRFEG